MRRESNWWADFQWSVGRVGHWSLNPEKPCKLKEFLRGSFICWCRKCRNWRLHSNSTGELSSLDFLQVSTGLLEDIRTHPSCRCPTATGTYLGWQKWVPWADAQKPKGIEVSWFRGRADICSQKNRVSLSYLYQVFTLISGQIPHSLWPSVSSSMW